MKKQTKRLLLALALSGSALTMIAQDNGTPPTDPSPPEAGPGGPPGPGPRRHRPPPPLIAALDANHDGVIDEQEIANAPAALKTLDQNGDGKLTPDELRPPPPPRPPGDTTSDNLGDARPPGGPELRGHRPPPSPVFRVLDVNHDGVIDEQEIANASAALKTLDKNGDGKLTRDELRLPPPEGPGGPERFGPPPDGNPGQTPPQQ